MAKTNYKLIQYVVSQSMSDTWEDARTEWNICGWKDNGVDCNDWDDCVCGHHGIRFAYTIRNLYTGNIIEPVGSKCINLFESEEMDDEIDAFEAEAKLKDTLSNIAACLMRAETITVKDYSPTLLKYLAENYPKYFYSTNEFEFILKMRRKKTTLSAKQQKWLNDWTRKANNLTVSLFNKGGDE